MNDEELIRLRKKIHAGQSLSRQETWKALDAITALRTQLADVQADLTFMTENRNKWQDSANQRWFRIEEAEARADRAKAALAAQIEADAGIAAAETAMPSQYNIKDQWRSGIGDEVAEAIRSQPHDRTALDRMLAEAEERGYEIAKAEAARAGWHLRRYDLAKRDAELANAQP